MKRIQRIAGTISILATMRQHLIGQNMKRGVLLIFVAAFALTHSALEAQQDAGAPSGRYIVGSSAFVAANLVLAGRPGAPDFYQLNAGYWFTERDALSVEVITWRNIAPVGIPCRPSWSTPVT